MDILYSETNKNLAWDVVINQIKDDFENFVYRRNRNTF